MWPNNSHKFHICIGWPAPVPQNWPYKSRAESQPTCFKPHLTKLRYIKPDLGSYLPRDLEYLVRRLTEYHHRTPPVFAKIIVSPPIFSVVIFGGGTAPHSRTRLFLSCVLSRLACNCGILWSYNVGYRTCGESMFRIVVWRYPFRWLM